jgi:serine/threonine protein kinase
LSDLRARGFDAALGASYLRERSVLTELRDAHVVSVRDRVVEGDRLAIDMDFVGGGSLRDAHRVHYLTIHAHRWLNQWALKPR